MKNHDSKCFSSLVYKGFLCYLFLVQATKLLFLSIALQSSLSEGEVGRKIDERLGALADGKSICEYIRYTRRLDPMVVKHYIHWVAESPPMFLTPACLCK